MTRLVTMLAAVLALGLGPGASAAPDTRDHTACLDSSSPTFSVDLKIVHDISEQGFPLNIFRFDGSSGVSEKFFRYLADTRCGIIMGFPVDIGNADPPDGLELTHSYLSTAYVLVTRSASTKLAKNAVVGVGMATAPHFYLAGAFGNAPQYVANTYQSQEQVLDALANHSIVAAMVWEPSYVRYARRHAVARAWHVAPLHIQHGRWQIAALYAEKNTAEAARFDAALVRLARSGELADLERPYTLETVR